MRARTAVTLAAATLFAVGSVVPRPGDALAAQEAATPRQRIVDYLLLYYVSDPNNTHDAYSPQLLDPEALLRGEEKSDFWHDRDIPNLQQLVRDLVQTSRDPEGRRFQRMVADLLDVRHRRVAVYLIDDAGHPLRDDGAVVRRRYGASVDATGRRVWPSANDEATLGPEGSHLGGAFATGEPNLGSGEEARLTFLHELTHVEIRSDMRPHLFEIGGKGFEYGLDGGHTARELLPDMSAAYDEGVAGSVELLYAPEQAAAEFARLDPDSFVVVESDRPDPARYSRGTVSPDVWLYDRLRDSGAKEYRTSERGMAAFRIGDLPPEMLLHNERFISVVVSEAVRRASDFPGLVRALRRTNLDVETRQRAIDLGVSRLTVRELAVLLREIGAEIRGADDPTAALASGGPRSHLLPLALVDYLTARSAESPSAFGELFDGQLDPEWLEAYWSAGRPLLNEAVPQDRGAGHAYTDLDSIGLAFGLVENAAH